jgi:hypothetical protein
MGAPLCAIAMIEEMKSILADNHWLVFRAGWLHLVTWWVSFTRSPFLQVVMGGAYSFPPFCQTSTLSCHGRSGMVSSCSTLSKGVIVPPVLLLLRLSGFFTSPLLGHYRYSPLLWSAFTFGALPTAITLLLGYCESAHTIAKTDPMGSDLAWLNGRIKESRMLVQSNSFFYVLLESVGRGVLRDVLRVACV